MRKLLGAGILCLLALPLYAQTAVSRTTADPIGAQIQLRYAQFDPLLAVPPVPEALSGGIDTNLWIVQLAGQPDEAARAAIRAAGGELHGYLPESAYVARMPHDAAVRVAQLAGIRWVGHYHPAFRIDPALISELLAGQAPARKLNIVVVDKSQDKAPLNARILGIGGEVTHMQPGSMLLEAALSGEQLLQALRFDEVLWIDRWSPAELDMNNARVQGGGNHVESQGGFTGSGVNGHVYEGVEAAHADFTNRPINVLSSGAAQTHGHCTAGIVCGNGTSTPNARGMAPDMQLYYTNYSTVSASRYQVVQQLVNQHEVTFTTASWGGGRTLSYTSTSAATDEIIFDHGIVWSNSQSNAGDQMSRPEAWAKNIFSIGGVRHYDNSNPNDDSWAAGGASIGPAADGRIKPDLCAYYESILCSDRTGSAGYSSGNFYTGFGGTSGATPIVAGHNALAIEMFAAGVFGNPPRVPGGTAFQNRPSFSTLKALQIACAKQYSFTSSSTDNRREHQGWGFPDLAEMYDQRGKIFIVDETDVLQQGGAQRYLIRVTAGEPELKIALSYPDPAANPSAAFTRINNVDLRVTAPNGTVYWGNHGLKQGNYSTSGGSADTIDTVECVFLRAPMAGDWKVDVFATLVVQDGHVETPALDVDYGLVANGGVFVPGGGRPGSIRHFGAGCPGSVQVPQTCPSLNGNGGSFANDMRAHEYAYEVTAPRALTVLGFRLYTRSSSGTVTTQAAFYLGAAGGGPLTSFAQRTTMQVGTALQFYEARLAQPVQVAAGAKFYISADHDPVYVCNLTGGQPGTGYYRRTPFSGGWTQSGLVDFPSYQIICQGGFQNLTPELVVSGAAEVGTTLSFLLTKALPRTPAILYTGISDQSWGAIPLPADLGAIGAPGCLLHISADIPLTLGTTTLGTATLPVPIPADPNFLGADLFHQVLVIDPPANQLGLVVSNAAEVNFGT